ncbi:TetR/AcrR family transcriptional regulator C-terminal domain-containing protein [Enterococcus dispar]|uniref:HTH tetR-type domain-containing protein n=1 Tax=Enterococcus dispar ATCC 51266 TaxID=1139219 RepID=S0KGS4_9ENTE|nr:TetR/AcrR family transcriptional regulator C-terminal domain-containing protein [Enterococcus dispar]EOT44034.1 hypothetical protein OMK_00177 [Enterococcus dispar ATCC 51266]EOW85709.1 hypothetical protein I569_01025 [Enterococcus dispar ATCC 51266]MCU7358055.1 TetR family transcriptional regulator C-terminal domain-containing protein [Enterococcus dispar]MDT2705571.1 TetR/AcrR family transcriptional regulator C-terminal domain-containing protein [Enterococcus dispar]OJG38883.1 hypothetica
MQLEEKKVDRRILKTKKAIKDAFTDLIMKNEIDTISIAMITEQANIGRKTFYLHYYDKYDLMDQIIAEYLEELGLRCNQNKIKRLGFEASTLEWFTFLDENFSLFARLFQSKAATSFRNQFLVFVSEQLRKKEKLAASKVSLAFKLQFLSYAVTGIIEEYITKDYRHKKQEVAKQLSIIVKQNLTL